jgi:hypothetical protein
MEIAGFFSLPTFIINVDNFSIIATGLNWLSMVQWQSWNVVPQALILWPCASSFHIKCQVLCCMGSYEWISQESFKGTARPWTSTLFLPILRSVPQQRVICTDPLTSLWQWLWPCNIWEHFQQIWGLGSVRVILKRIQPTIFRLQIMAF